MAKRFYNASEKLGKYGVPAESFVEDFGAPLIGDMPDTYGEALDGIEKRFNESSAKMKKNLNRGQGQF